MINVVSHSAVSQFHESDAGVSLRRDDCLTDSDKRYFYFEDVVGQAGVAVLILPVATGGPCRLVLGQCRFQFKEPHRTRPSSGADLTCHYRT